ncbi:hypothetical protein WJX72_005227 [[Myrmecia] bisecta]|uniref:Large ribosomal subunit protein uL11m n=1 Tax=[Myrmecia] bisecta TaxID=41462 RepID=A0AAW1QFA5_9CHLO
MSKAKAKAVTATIRLVINAAGAKPAPPVGPALGQAGLNIMKFCKDFNAKTADLQPDVPVPVVITAYSDRTFTYVAKTPPTTYFIKKAAGLKMGSQRPGHTSAGTISAMHIYEIAIVKQKDFPELSLESLSKSIAGTCKSMGIKVVPRPEDA